LACRRRLYFDECVPVTVVTHLRAEGHDVTHAVEVGNRGASNGWDDEAQLLHAAAEDRILVTQNRDDFRREHRKLTGAGGIHPGILLLSAAYKPSVLAEALGLYLERTCLDFSGDCILVPVAEILRKRPGATGPFRGIPGHSRDIDRSPPDAPT
jgi:predicted nuclease of predicted toxin-antitoxin system